MTCLIRFRILLVGDLTHPIGNYTCHIRNHQLICIQKSLLFQFVKMMSPFSSELSLSQPQLNQHLRIQNLVISLNRCLSSLSVNTENSINL